MKSINGAVVGVRDDIRAALQKNKEANRFFNIKRFEKSRNVKNTIEHIKEDEEVFFIHSGNVTPDPEGELKPNSMSLKGKTPSVIVITDKRVFVHYKIFPEERIEQIPVGDIRSVDMKKDMYSSKIRVSSMRKTFDIDSTVKKKDYVLIMNALEKAMSHDNQTSSATVHMPDSKEDAVKALRELASLRDDGILSEDEFEKKKEELLAQI